MTYPDCEYPECKRCIRSVGLVNLWGNSALMVFKLAFGLMCGSVALLADALHSLGDTAISIVLLMSLYISGKKADEDHHFGHGKIEFVGTSIIGFSMLAVAVLITWFGLRSAMQGTNEAPDRIAILVSIISIGGNYLLYRYSLCAGVHANSSIMVANAHENLADVLSSVAALIGIVGAQLGWPLLDPVAAVIIGVLIFRSAFRTLLDAARGLGDSGLEPAVTREIRATVEDMDGVIGVERIRSRRIGQKVEVGLRVNVDASATVGWSRGLAETIRASIRNITGIEGSVRVGFQGVERP